MSRLSKLVAVALFAGITATSATALAANDKSIRIATWNLTDLWHEPERPLRRGTRLRRTSELNALKKYAANLNADIVALQGIGSPTAASMLFPAKDYYVIFSRELAVRMQSDRDILSNPFRRRVYTAIAIRRASKIRVLAREHVLELADPSPKLGSRRPQGQSGIAIRVRIGKRPVWILSATVLANCKSKAPACRAQSDQIDLLNYWKGLKSGIKEPVIIAGALPNPFATETSRNVWTRLLEKYPARTRKREKGRKRARRFALSNRTLPAKNATLAESTNAPLQPNTVALSGPTRAPGKRLVPKQSERKKNFVIDALNDFASVAFTAKPKATEQKPEQVKRTSPAAPTPKPIKLNTAHFDIYPTSKTETVCKARTPQQSYLIVDQSLNSAVREPSFGTPTAQIENCPAVYLDLPRGTS